MRSIIFAGPSIPRGRLSQIADADVANPICRGDLVRLSETYDIFVILDGEFGQSLSVSPKEILRLGSRIGHGKSPNTSCDTADLASSGNLVSFAFGISKAAHSVQYPRIWEHRSSSRSRIHSSFRFYYHIKGCVENCTISKVIFDPRPVPLGKATWILIHGTAMQRPHARRGGASETGRPDAGGDRQIRREFRRESG